VQTIVTQNQCFSGSRLEDMNNIFLCEKVGNSEKSSEALKIQNGQFEKKRKGFGIRSAPLQGQPNS
jgi:hypothetical protein